MRRLARILGTLLIAGGLATLAWAVVVWQWQDPFTAAYTTYQQHKLKVQYKHVLDEYVQAHAPKPATVPSSKPVGSKNASSDPQHRPPPEVQAPSLAAERAQVARDAAEYRRSLKEGQVYGRLKVPRLGLSILTVNGTDGDTLTRGPGRYLGSYLPGEGELVYIAGHRTTYLAPFAKIDQLRPGDRATLELPYATFEYVATGHVIVSGDDLSVLQSHHRDVLALQACHPRFFASHRYIVYFKLRRVTPRYGPSYSVSGTRLAAA
jgi:sortase A